METSGLGSGMFSGMGPGMLGLEMPGLHQNPPSAHNATSSLQHQPVVGYDPHHPQAQQIKPSGYTYSSSKPKHQLTLSDDDEPGFHPDESSGGDPKKNGGGGGGGSSNKSSPWQRMKWTDTMVKLLIMAVFYIGDEGGSETTSDPKKKASGGGGGGLLQKKGKWKSVSRAMMEKGFYVSPQQCEDKFNDLNKRYKRVNDILGKGTACRVVENQSLLETMDLSPKMKEEVKKLLNSKHLFFREMCAYHTSCGHGVSACGGGTQNSSEPPNPQPHQRFLQGAAAAAAAESHPHLGEKDINKTEADSSKVVGRGGSGEDYDEDDDDDMDDDDDDYDDDDHEDHEHDNHPSRKRSRGVSYSPSPAMMQQLNGEVMGVVQDTGKSPWEKKQWVKGRLLQLEEQQVRYRGEAYELEKQRLKWVKFSGKKEREMEMAKLENERRLLENERMALLLRQKEIELLSVDPLPNPSNKRSEPSSITL
ncbi:hypothetical protein SAY87_024068 [Trapa incisa]|uniref:Myb/SANT-like DNA-binding domain-containing protein n=1 Tax=Trapa incisa TaxID=236973 RepID=A0AAN7L7X5_9MYRT|nr:hypothetical protein SAY87_024068 [Trapa incisa]